MTKRRQSGIAAVEFAFVLIPLLTLLFGITEFGRAMYEYNTIAKAARDATRLMSTQAPADPDYAALKTTATCFAVHGNTGCTGAPLLPGLTTAMIDICDPISCPVTHAGIATGTGTINLVTVTIGSANTPYQFNSLAPWGVATFNFAPVGVTMRQVL